MGLAAMAVDVGVWYHEKALAKKAADAAALAAAWCYSGNTCAWNGATSTAQTVANNYAADNGALSDVKLSYPYAGHGNWVNAYVKVPMKSVFAPVFGFSATGKYVTASATADFTSNKRDFPSGKSGLGVSAAYNYSVFGPMAYHSYGDEWGTKYLNNGTINPNYATGGGRFGYYFDLNINANYQSTYGSKFQVELFDPSCYVTSSGQQVDEIRPQNPSIPGYEETTETTTTWFTVQYLDQSTGQWTDATAVNGNTAQVSFSGESWPHLQWVDSANMQIDMSQYPANTSFRVNVTSTDPSIADPVNANLNGSSENGFNLRAGPLEPAGDLQNQDGSNNIVTMGQNTTATSGQAAEESAWSIAYGTNGISVAASGNMQLNINNANNGSNTISAVPLDLGNIPADALGGTFTVTRFDTDVGATSLYYYDNGATPSNLKIANGSLANSKGDDTEYQDSFTVTQAGEITATYTGGTADTSDWSIAYSGFPGRISLVGQQGLSY
jgi:hypothetical protein